MDNSNIPEEYRPISAWGYVGYNLLFSIPLVGFILLIVFAFDSSNLNRRSYARSFFATWLIIAIIVAIVLIFMAVVGIGMTSFNTNF